MKLIDSHTHLILDQYNDDRDNVINQAFSSGITHIMLSCDNLEEIKKNLELTTKYENIYCSVGVHPHEANSWTKTSRSEIIEYAKQKKVIAIGETGLDYYYNLSPKSAQIEAFKEQVKIAKEVSLPLIIHTRDAEKETLEILNEFKPHKGVFHCYTGTMETAKSALELGFYISWSGILTFKNAGSLKEIAKEIPIEKTLIETDCPFLTPIPHRGKRNEPKFVKHIAEELARIKDIPVEQICEITAENTKDLFGIE